MLIPIGAIGADYAAVGSTTVATLKARGVTFVCRYVTYHGPTWKTITKAEADSLLAGGIGILLVWETSITAGLGGRAQGLVDGAEAALQAATVGYPAGLAILVAIDTDTYAGNVNAIALYLRAFAERCHPYTAGLYGDEDSYAAARDVLTTWCLPNAWGWSPHIHAGAPFPGHIRQGPSRAGWDYPNVVTNSFECWGNTPAPLPDKPPTQREAAMANVIYQPNDADAEFYAVTNDRGAAIWCEWVGSGGDARAMAIRAAHINAGATLVPTVAANLTNVGLIGQLPVGDSRKDWATTDFRSTPNVIADAEPLADAVGKRIDKLEDSLFDLATSARNAFAPLGQV